MAISWTCPVCTFVNADELLMTCEMCLTARAITCANCQREIRAHEGRVVAVNRTYHRDCFRCAACHQNFSTPQFQLKDGEPYHLDCYRTLFLPVCEVCEQHIPTNAAGNVVYKLVPFWEMRYCPTHDDRARCCSCQRLEPVDPRKHFEALSDGRKTCHECCMSVILDTNEVQAVVEDVWQFMKSIGISLPKLPVYLVEYNTLNEHQQASHEHRGHSPPTTAGFITRGLCLSEVTEIQHLARRGSSHVPQVVRLEKNRSVNAILILHGLPYDLTAQVLAHEATHAYIKLHNAFPDHIPPIVEEGTCQLISYLWLKYKHLIAAPTDGSPTGSSSFDTRLREYFMQQIEQDASPVYGEGFRRALDAYERTHSLQRLFDSVREFGCLP